MKKLLDGVLPLVLVLSLLRTNEISDYLDELYGNGNGQSDINEIILGPLVGFTQSNYPRIQNSDYIGHNPFKNMDYMQSVLQDIHSLSRFRRFDGIDTNIDAWWYTSGGGSVGEHEDTDEDYVSDEMDAASSSDSNHSDESECLSDSEALACASERTETVVRADELTLEDMELIDILWHQDIDLGLAKDFYECDVKKKDEEIAIEQIACQTQIEDTLLLQPFAIDNETGESLYYIPVTTTVAPEMTQTAADGTVSQQLPDGNNSQMQQMPDNQMQYDNIERDYVLENQLMELLQLATENNNSVGEEHMLMYHDNSGVAAVQPSQQFSNQEELQVLDNLDIGSLLQPISLPRPSLDVTLGGFDAPAPRLIRETSIEGQWRQLVELWNNDTVPAIPQQLLRDNVSMTTTNATLPWLPEFVESLPQVQRSDSLLSNISFTPSITLTNVTDIWPDELAPQLFNFQTPDVDGHLNATTADTLLEQASQKSVVGAWPSMLARDAMEEGASGGDDSGAGSYSSSPDQEIKSEPEDWNTEQRYSRFYNDTVTNATSMFLNHQQQNPSANKRRSRHSTASSIMSNESEESAIGARHNHTYTSLVAQPNSARQSTDSRERAARAQTQEEEDDLQSTRDAQRLQDLNIPISYEDIVETPVDKFNRLLQHQRLTEVQMQFVRDVRRRGKNKVAAQNCRKRKLEVIHSLDGEVSLLQQKKTELMREQTTMSKRIDSVKLRIKELEESLLRSLHEGNGQPVNTDSYRLQFTSDGALYAMPSDSTLTDDSQPNRNRKKKGGKKSE